MSAPEDRKARREATRATLPPGMPEHFDVRHPLVRADEATLEAARDPLAERVARVIQIVRREHEAEARTGQLLGACMSNDCTGRCPRAESCNYADARGERDFSHIVPVEGAAPGPDAPTEPVVIVVEVQGAEPGEAVLYCECTGLFGECLPEHCARCPHAHLKGGRSFYGARPR